MTRCNNVGPTICLFAASMFAIAARAEADQSQRVVDYSRDVQPIFASRCFQCHAAEKQESNLRLDVKAAALRGGDSGEPPIVPGNSRESFLLRVVSDPDSDVVMPPEGPRLSGEQIDVLRRWIDQGAAWPQAGGDDEKLTTEHWSFQPVSRPVLPETAHDTWVLNPVDAFILEKLDAANLRPSDDVDRVTLIRRLYLDVLGLPPAPDEVNSFVADSRVDAFERLVDRVLASPRYGERWARHWLDVVRFAESNGFETNRERPNAWPFRDYVIDALNADKPYDQFVKEQIAGDALDADAATGFLVGGPYDVVKSPDINLTLMQRQDELADMVNTTGTAFLGLTLGCARCHNHKFDPILQKDYYSMQAVFAGVQHGERPLDDGQAAKRSNELARIRAQQTAIQSKIEQFLATLNLAPPVNAEKNVERFPATRAKWIRFTVLATNNNSQPCIDELEVFTAANERNVARASDGAKASSSSNLPGYAIHKLEHVNDGQYGNSHSWISNESGGGWVRIELAEPVLIDRIVWGRDRELKYRDRVATRYRIEVAAEPDKWTVVASSENRVPPAADIVTALADNLQRLRPEEIPRAEQLVADHRAAAERITKLTVSLPTVYAGTFSEPAATHRLYRGDPLAKREIVAPDALTITGSLGLAVDAPERERRIALAGWIADPQNPLTPRVIVNRLWHYHFGRGLVATPSDVGVNGARPTHPELLDWLAAELIQHDWSLKHVQRLILTSRTFRQSSRPRVDELATDADCRWLWRFPPRRLEAEAIRDSILAVSGNLDLQMGGSGFSLFDVQLENVRHYFPKEKLGPDQWRRMIYMTKFRQEQDDVFGAFDCPDGNQTVPRRAVSTTPLQALNLLNSNFTLQQAEIFASRLQADAPADRARQIRRAFQLMFCRDPDEGELATSSQFMAQFGLSAFSRVLLNSNEFLFVP